MEGMGKKSKSRGVSCYNYNDYESSYYDDFPYASDKDDSSYADLVYNICVHGGLPYKIWRL